MNGAIEVFIIKRVFIVPDASRRVGDFIPHEPKAIVSRVRL